MNLFDFGADCAIGIDSGAETGKPLLGSPLFRESPAAEHHTVRAKKWDDLLVGDGERRLRALMTGLRFTAQLIERRGPRERPGFAVRVSDGARHPDRSFCVNQTLVGEAEMPQNAAQEGMTSHAVVKSLACSLGVITLGLIEGDALLQMASRHCQISQPPLCIPT